MIGALLFGQYLTAGLATYTPSMALKTNVGGVEIGVRNGTLNVQLSATGQSTAAFGTSDQRPVPFSRCTFGFGSLSPIDLVFNGEVGDTNQTFDQDSGDTITVWDTQGVDSTAQFNRHLVYASFTNVNADVAAEALIAAYAPDFSGARIQSGLAAITLAWSGETMDTVFAAIAQTIGGYYYRDLAYRVHLFTSETPDLTPDALDANNTSLVIGSLQFDANTSQTRNRILGVGANAKILAAVLPGETIIPLDDATIFDNAANTVLLSKTQRVTYTGKNAGGSGTMVGPGIVPSTRPDTSLSAGTDLPDGVYGYGFTWTTAAGQSLPSPVQNVTCADLSTPPAPTIVTRNPAVTAGSAYAVGDSVSFIVRWEWAPDNAYNEGNDSATVGPFTVFADINGNPNGFDLTPTFDPTTLVPSDSLHGAALNYNIYLSVNGGSYNIHRRIGYASAQGGLLVQCTSSAWAGAGHTKGAVNKTIGNVTVSSLAVGPTGVTGRKTYRTAVGGSQLKLQNTIANNTSTSQAVDTVADGSLGANAPSSDTSGISTTAGTVAPGSTSMVIAGGGGLPSGGGWLQTGTQVIRYAAISGGSVTGIPATGPGSIQTAISYGSQITVAPSLTGIPASGAGAIIVSPLLNDPVNLFAQRDDTVSQGAVAAIEGVNAQGIASDGIYEAKIEDSTQISQSALNALCDADLALYSSSLGVITVTYSTFDRKSYPGRPLVVNLSDLGLSGTFVIQTVQVTFADSTAPPVYQCVASSVRYTLQDLLQHFVTRT